MTDAGHRIRNSIFEKSFFASAEAGRSFLDID